MPEASEARQREAACAEGRACRQPVTAQSWYEVHTRAAGTHAATICLPTRPYSFARAMSSLPCVGSVVRGSVTPCGCDADGSA